MERTPSAALALHPHSSAHHVDQPRRNCKAQARPAVLAGPGAVGLRKGLKNKLQLVPRDANPGILHLEVQFNSLISGDASFYPDHDLALFGELNGIAQKIQQDLTQSMT